MQLREDIKKQIEAGFSFLEIQQNMAAKGYSYEEIDKVYADISAIENIRAGGQKKFGVRSVISIILFIIVIIRLMMRCSHMNY